MIICILIEVVNLNQNSNFTVLHLQEFHSMFVEEIRNDLPR